MSTRVVYDCDGCGAQGSAEHLGLRVDKLAGDKDLCEQCTKLYRLDVLATLVKEFGRPIKEEAKPAPKKAVVHAGPLDRPWPCTQCPKRSTSRTSILNHMVSQHGFTRVQASHAIPPLGLNEPCSICTFLADPGTGMAIHLKQAHGQAAYEQWRIDKNKPTKKEKHSP